MAPNAFHLSKFPKENIKKPFAAAFVILTRNLDERKDDMKDT